MDTTVDGLRCCAAIWSNQAGTDANTRLSEHEVNEAWGTWEDISIAVPGHPLDLQRQRLAENVQRLTDENLELKRRLKKVETTLGHVMPLVEVLMGPAGTKLFDALHEKHAEKNTTS